MRVMRIAGSAIVLTLIAALVADAESNSQKSGQLPPSPRDVSPLLIGETIPRATLKTSTGDTVELRALTRGVPTLLIFYRGKW